MVSVVGVVVGFAIYVATVAWVVNGTHTAAREGARAASLGQDVDAAVQGALPGVSSDPTIRVFSGTSSDVTVEITVVYDLPLKSIKVTREVTMRRQR